MNTGKIKQIPYRALSAFFIICVVLATSKIAYADSEEISYDQLSTGTINNSNYADWWKFYGVAGDDVTIYISGVGAGDLDPYLELWFEMDGAWELLISDDDSGHSDSGVSAKISHYELPYTGTYTIGATRFAKEEGTSSGDYSMGLWCHNCKGGSADTNSSPLNEGNGCTYYAEWPTTSDLDSDCDGFSDDLETLLFNSFSPILVLDEEEDDCTDDPVNSFDVLYQVSPYETDERYSHRGALITVVVLWSQDCGGFSSSITGHPGDAETMRVWVTQSPFDSKWSVTGMLWRVHGDNWNYEPVDGLYNSIGEVNFGWHYLMYVAESKHAMYPSKRKCESRHYGLAEDCDDGEIILLSNMNVSPSGNVYSRVVPSSHNVGEVNNRNFDQLGETGDYYLNFPNTYAWSDKFSDGREMVFCGHEEEIRIGPESWGDCPGGIFSKWWPDTRSDRYQKAVNLLKTHN